MRILNFVGAFPSVSETFIANQVRGARQRGCDVWVYAAYGPPPAGKRAPICAGLSRRVLYAPAMTRSLGGRLASGGRLFARMARQDTVRAVRLLNVFRYGWDAAALKLLHRAAPLLGQEGFDVIHCQFGSLAPLALALRREGIIKGAVMVNFRGHDISAAIDRFGPHMYDGVFRDADLFVTNCEYFQKRLLKLGCDPERLRIVYSGIDTDAIAYRPPRDDVRLLRLVAVGRLVEKKGIAYAIDAAAELRARGVEFDLRIIGEGPTEPALRSRVARLGLGAHVSFLGALPHERVLATLAQCDVMVSPNLTAADGDEDAPVNTIKEAMAVGLPVVSTRHGGIPELVVHGVTGLLAEERDAQALARHIECLSASAPLRHAMSAAGRAQVKKLFELSVQHDRLMAAYREASRIHEQRTTGAPPVLLPGPTAEAQAQVHGHKA